MNFGLTKNGWFWLFFTLPKIFEARFRIDFLKRHFWKWTCQKINFLVRACSCFFQKYVKYRFFYKLDFLKCLKQAFFKNPTCKKIDILRTFEKSSYAHAPKNWFFDKFIFKNGASKNRFEIALQKSIFKKFVSKSRFKNSFGRNFWKIRPNEFLKRDFETNILKIGFWSTISNQFFEAPFLKMNLSKNQFFGACA